jgi:zinc transporter
MDPARTGVEPRAALYGGDACGLICGYLFLEGKATRAIDSAQAAEPLLTEAGEGFLWLHFNLSHAGALPWIRRQTSVSEDFVEALSEEPRSSRIERDGNAVFGVINDVTFDFAFEASDVSTLWLNVSRRLVLSARRQPLRAVDRLRTQVRDGQSMDSPVRLLDHLMRDQADELQRIVRRAAERIDEIEDAMLAGLHHRHGGELARLRRLLVRLQRLLAPEPGALQRLLTHPPEWVRALDVEHLHGANEEFALVLRDIGTLQERAKLMQDEAAGRVAEENGRSLFTLTMVTVLALPINLLAGLLGMNVGGIPMAGNAHGFWIMLALIAGLTALIAVVALRRIGPRRA